MFNTYASPRSLSDSAKLLEIYDCPFDMVRKTGMRYTDYLTSTSRTTLTRETGSEPMIRSTPRRST